MQYLLIAIYDRAVEAYAAPTYHHAKGGAMRAFADEINRKDENNPLFRHPVDYDLYCFGSFDDGAGKFILLDEPELLCRGQDVSTVSVKS